MSQKIFGFTFSAVLLVLSFQAEAQQPKKVPQVGYLDAGFPSMNATRIEAFRQGLRDLGYVEGKNIVVHYRHAEGQPDRLPALLAEMLRLKVEIIVAGGGGGATTAARE